MTVPINERISRYLATLDPSISGQGGHNTLFRAAAILVWGFGIDPEASLPFLAEYNQRSEPVWPERELRRKLAEAARHPGNRPCGYLLGGDQPPVSNATPQSIRPVSEVKPTYDRDKLKKLANKLPVTIDGAYLEARSKFTCWNRSPAGFLHKLYKPGKKIVIFASPFSQGAEVWEHPGASGNLAGLDHLQCGCEEGVWFLAQPVTGEFVELDRLKTDRNPSGRSRRCEECVTSWRFAVIESDQADPGLWLKALVQLPLPISSICTSGGRSIHSLIRIDADSKAECDAIVRGRLLAPLVAIGADPGAMTAVRLTRLPGCMREEKQQEQRLLFLDDDPDGTPICERFPREEPEAVWLRWAHSLIYHHQSEETEPGSVEACLAGLQQFAPIWSVKQTIRSLEALHVG